MKFNEVKLHSGRTVFLCELHQFLTYEGLLEGLPTLESNQAVMDTLVAERHGKPYPVGPAYLIKPEQKLINFPGKYPFGTPAKIPGVTCVGRFESSETPIHHSGLVVIWYQDQFAFPIEPMILEKILDIDWDSLAAKMEL